MGLKLKWRKDSRSHAEETKAAGWKVRVYQCGVVYTWSANRLKNATHRGARRDGKFSDTYDRAKFLADKWLTKQAASMHKALGGKK